MRRLLTLGLVLSFVAMVQPAQAALVSTKLSPFCQPTSSTPDVPESRRVQAVLIVGDTVYMGGRFDRVLPPGGGSPVVRNHLVACSLSTGAVLPWNPDASGADALRGSVFSLVHDGTRLYVGGAFDGIGGVPVAGLAALDPNPSIASPKPLLWAGRQGPGTWISAAVKALALSPDRKTLYAGGNFSTFGYPGSRESRVGLAAVNTADGALTGWVPRLISETDCSGDPTCRPREVEIRALTARADKVIAAGFFSEQSIVDDMGADWRGEGHVAAFHPATGASLPWDYKPRFPVLALGSDAAHVYMGAAGQGVSQNVLVAAAASDGTVDWTAYADGNWQAVWATPDAIYGGGHMLRCGTKAQASEGDEPLVERMCAFNPATGKRLDWAPTHSNGELGIFGIGVSGTAMIAVGEFERMNETRQTGAAKLGSAGPAGLVPPGPDPGPGPQVPGGYRLVASDGGIFAFGDATFEGSTGNIALNQPIIGMAPTPSGKGYWLLAADGGIFAFGDAGFHGSTGDLRLVRPIVTMAPTPSGNGYWLVASDGGVFSFGDAAFYGSTGDIQLAKPIVSMAPTPTGAGYWMVASDGGIFAFGDAKFHGSTGDIALAMPIMGMASTRSGNGYWMVASDGGMFAFGDAKFLGSTGDIRLAKPIVGMTATKSGLGYWLVADDGGIFAFGDAAFFGSTGDIKLAKPIVGMARS